MLEVLWIDEQVVAVRKPGGVPSQGDQTGDPDVLSLLRSQLNDGGLQLVHRLDRPVSGVMLFARTLEAARTLNDGFQKRTISKTYWAIVQGSYKAGVLLRHTITHDPQRHKARAGGDTDDRDVSLAVNLLGRGDRYSLLEVVPHGGAFHQIRVQLSLSGHPIKGDVKYGARRGEKDRTIALHARSITFLHPVSGAATSVIAEPPSGGIWAALQQAGSR
ncbi:MAG: RluA family pseudouridine synthase [Flavobacteriales bacterium]|nr:RluA family pseudouridine synthase [Flavobacteriales bacterium]